MPGSPFWGLHLADERLFAESLTVTGQLEVRELFEGLEIQACSWVGRVEFERLAITIQPGIPDVPLLHHFRYAYGLGQLPIPDQALFGREQGAFQGLVARQLAWEVEELIRQGLHRDSRRETAELAAPRGSIDCQGHGNAGGGGRASLPRADRPHPRVPTLSGVLLAGTLLARRATDDIGLRGRLRRAGRALGVGPPPPDVDLLAVDALLGSIDRRMRAYEPALKLIRLLAEGLGSSPNDHDEGSRLPGFLFDMNRFVRALPSRFLSRTWTATRCGTGTG